MRRAIVTLLSCIGGVVFLLLPAVASASLTIDVHTNAIGSNKPSITTTQTNDVIVLLVTNEKGSNAAAATVTSVSDTAGLHWSLRAATSSRNIAPAGGGSVGADTEVWWALSSAALTNDAITVTFSGTFDCAAKVAFGVNGANTSSPWDANASLPKYAQAITGGTPTVNGISTTNANTMLFGFLGSADVGDDTGGTPYPAGTGYTVIDTGDTGACGFGATSEAEYKTVSSAQSSVSAAFGHVAPSGWFVTGDAIQAPSASTGRIIRLVGGIRLIGGVRLGGTSAIPNCGSGFTNIGNDVCREFLTKVGSGTFTVPSNWNNSNNSIEVIGGGAGGDGATTFAGGTVAAGSGGGGYSKITNQPLSGTVGYSVGAGGSRGAGGGSTIASGVGGNGGDTYFCSDNTANCSDTSGTFGGTVIVAALGGKAATTVGTGGAGGAAASGVGNTKRSGGVGGASANFNGVGGAGGGAGGPQGDGGHGGAGTTGTAGGSGGGGAGGGGSGTNGSAGGDGVASNTTGKAGGNNAAGAGGATAASNGAAGNNGSNGGGGSGAGAGGTPGGQGGAGTDWDSSHGAGGGGGAGASTGSSAGGAGGLYGGAGGNGGGLGTAAETGGAGAQGLIVVTYHL